MYSPPPNMQTHLSTHPSNIIVLAIFLTRYNICQRVYRSMHSPSPTAVRLPNVVLWQLYRRSLHYIGLHTNGNIMHRLDWYIRASDVYYGFLCLVSVGSSDIDPQPASSIHSATAMSRLFQPHWTPEIERTVKHGLYSDHPVGQIMTYIAVGDVEKRTGRLP